MAEVRFAAARAENQRALAVSACLDATLLREAECWLGGGTAVSLRCAEFRVSRDVDFLCASRDGYRLLRQRVFERGVEGLFARPVTLAREARVDRYGIRTAVAIDGATLKLELVSEGRVALHGTGDPALPVARLSDMDLVTEKLLANTDRYLDDAFLARDAIDLIVLEHTLGALPPEAFESARGAYGDAVNAAWRGALERLRDRPVETERFLTALGVTSEAREVVLSRLAAVA